MEHVVMEHKILNVDWKNNQWTRLLKLELDKASREGWVPVLYSDAGGKATVILTRPREQQNV